jgi:hypothetical protein
VCQRLMEIFGAQDGIVKKEEKEQDIGVEEDDDRGQAQQSRMQETERGGARPMTVTPTATATSSRRVPPFPSSCTSAAQQPRSPAVPSPLPSPLDQGEAQDDRDSALSEEEDPEEYEREMRWKTRERELMGSPSVPMEDDDEGDSGRFEPQRNGSLAMMDPLEEFGGSDEEEDGRGGGASEVNEVRSTRAAQKRQVSSGARCVLVTAANLPPSFHQSLNRPQRNSRSNSTRQKERQEGCKRCTDEGKICPETRGERCARNIDRSTRVVR